MYTPKKTMEAEASIASAYDGPMYTTGALAVQFVFDIEGAGVIITPIEVDQKSKLRGDIDNYVKTYFDALNGVAWGDDAQVVKIEAVKI